MSAAGSASETVLNPKIEQLESEKAELVKEKVQLKAELGTLKAELAALREAPPQSAAGENRDAIKEKEDRIEKKEARIADKDNAITAMNNAIAAKDNAITERLKLERAQEERKKAEEDVKLEQLKRSPRSSTRSSGNTSGGGTPKPAGYAQRLRASASSGGISRDYASSSNSELPPSPQSAAQTYSCKISRLAVRVGMTVSRSGGNLIFSNGVEAVGQIRVPDGDEKATDAFYKKVYYYWFFQCQLDVVILAENQHQLENYAVPKHTPPASGLQRAVEKISSPDSGATFTALDQTNAKNV